MKTVPVAIGILRRPQGVLLIRRIKPPYQGQWSLVGGKIDPGEHPHKALVREFYEETGLAVRPTRFLGLVSEQHHERGLISHFLLHLFALEEDDPQRVPSGQEGDLAFFDPLPKTLIPSDRWMLEHLWKGTPRYVALSVSGSVMLRVEEFPLHPLAMAPIAPSGW